MADGATIFQGLLDRGFNAAQAAALAGNIEQESSFDPAAHNAASDAHGLMQWRLDRKSALDSYAKSTSRAADDSDTQLDFIVHEMQGSEAKNAAPFLSAQDVQSANDALKSYIRYGTNESGKRLQYAQAFAGGPDVKAAATVPSASPTSGFVNPAFSGGMPRVPSFGTPAAPAAVSPVSGTQAAPAAPAAGGAPVSDDDLLKAFLPDSAPSAGTAASSSPDDAILAPFLKGALAGPAATTAEPQQAFPGADFLSTVFQKGVESLPIVGEPLINALTGFKAYVHGGSFEDQKAIDDKMAQGQPVASGIGTVAGEVAPYLVGGAIPGVAKALGMSGNLLTRIAMGGVSNAAIQGGDTLARGGSIEDAKNNALLGGAVGSAAAPVADVLGAGVNKLLAGTAPEVAKLAQLARDKFGIPIGPGQMSDNPMVRFTDSVVNKMPFSGGTVSNAAQQTAFNKAVANAFGETTDHITPDVMAAAKARIGNDFDTVAQKVTSIPYDQPLEASLAKIESDAGSVLQSSQFAPLKGQLDQMVSRFAKGNNAITGETYQALTSKGSPLDRLMNDADPNVSYYAVQVRDALDDALARNAPQDAQALLKQARSQYKAMKTVEPLVEKAPTGDISPPLLMNRVTNSYGNVAYGGGGDLADLARIGQRFLKAPPSSGTAERLAVMELGKKLLGPTGAAGAVVAGALNPAAIPMAVATGVPTLGAYALLAKLAGAGLRSDALANKLIGNSLGTAAKGTGGTINVLTRSAAGLPSGAHATINDVVGGVPGTNNGQAVTILRPRKDGTGYFVQLPDGQIGSVGSNLLMAPAQ